MATLAGYTGDSVHERRLWSDGLPEPTGSAPDYRPDIDGLRAVAVLAVILFHAELDAFSGGYVGVDIFFVISGFIITRLIAPQIARGEFSLVDFYERRIRRLFPALFVMLLVSTLVGALILLPDDFASLSRNALGAAGFVANIFYWMQTGYFEGDAHVRVLLHTWSLAVEEQFYILFPLFLLGLARFWPRHLVGAVGAVALLSFVACLWAMTADPSAAFYLTPFRAWELLVGALLALGLVPPAPSSAGRAVAGMAGLAMVMGAIIGFDEMTPFPGAAALLPCLGAALLIHAGQASPSGRLLSLPPMRFLGRISYSAYLWHWPLFVFINYYVIESLSLWQHVGLVGIAILLGALSWRLIEQPFRHVPAGREARSSAFVAAGGGAILVCALSLFIYLNRGLPDRFPDRAVRLAHYSTSMNPESDRCENVDLQLEAGSSCTIGDPKRADIFLWGDSHAAALFGALDPLAREGRGIIYGATPQCPPLLEMGTTPECIEGNRRKLAFVLSRPEVRTVILAARWSLYLEGRYVEGGDAETNNGVPQLIGAGGHHYRRFSRSARRAFRSRLDELVEVLLRNGKHIVLLYPVPETGYDIPSTLALMSSRGENPADFTISHFLYLQRQRRAIRILDGLGEQPGLTRIRPDRIFCKASRCMTYANGAALYFDSHHLSIPGAALLFPVMRQAIGPVPQGGMRAGRATERRPSV